MRLLTPAGGVLVCAVTVLALTLTATPSTAHPPTEPDHGVNATTYHTLWADDVDIDEANATALRARAGNASAIAILAAATDVPLDAPPGAVERWNRRDLAEFPRTAVNASVYPPDATLTDGAFVRDAHATVFAVQPSTRARLSPTDQPLYVASNGTLLGTVDYRVAEPPDDRQGARQVVWELTNHTITETRLRVDGALESTATGTHTPRHAYDLADDAGTDHTLTLEADVFVELRKRSRICTAGGGDACLDWASRVEYPNETLTVRATVPVVEYTLALSGYRTRYPNGDVGLVVYANRPWLGYQLPEGSVRGVWRFYAAGDPHWNTLVTSTADGTTTAHAPLHPVQVNAYPIEGGPTATRNVTLLATYGVKTQPPTLPEAVALDVPVDPYTASCGIATRTRGPHTLADVRVDGLVRGASARPTAASFASVPVIRSELSLAVLNATADTVTVRASLTEATTGEPIATATHEGAVVVQGERVNTTANGTVTVTLPRSTGGVSARYEPGPWWRAETGYVGDSVVVSVAGGDSRLLPALGRLAIPVAAFLLGVFLIDRITGVRVWPPWRRL